MLQLAHVRGFEGHRTEQHGVEHDASTPNIGLEAAVAFSFEHFWCDVSGCTTLLMLNLVLTLDKLADTEVTDLDVTLRSQKNIIQFDISMEHTFAVYIHQSLYKLAEHMLGQILLELSPSAHVGQQVTAATNFHDVDSVRVRVETFVQAHDVLVSGTLQDVILLHDLL